MEEIKTPSQPAPQTKKGMPKVAIVIIVIVLLFAVLGFAAKMFIFKGTGIFNFSANENSATIKTDDGQTIRSGDSISLPTGFPSNIPTYPGATIKVATFKADSDFMLGMETTDKLDVAVAKYKSLIEAKGWTVKGDTSNTIGGLVMLSIENSTMAGTLQVVGADTESVRMVNVIGSVEDKNTINSLNDTSSSAD